MATTRARTYVALTPNHSLSPDHAFSHEPLAPGRPSPIPVNKARRKISLCAAFGIATLISILLAVGSLPKRFSWSSLLREAFHVRPLSFVKQPDLLWHGNGHVYLSSAQLAGGHTAHPIPHLIADASRRWHDRVSQQSATLSDAVAEYKRRYGRHPPKGFDRWFRFAQDNGVVLIDDYDGIEEDIAPFLALDPQLLRSRMAIAAEQPNTHTLVIKAGHIDIVSAHGDAGLARAQDQRDLLSPCVTWLSETNVTISPHDGPSILMDYDHKRRHREAGQRGSVLPDDYANSVDDDPSLWGFPLACAPDSALRRAHNGLEVGSMASGLSFVHDHTAAMDLCRNPEWQDLHGFTSWPGPRPSVLQPIFSMSRSTMHSDIRLTPLEQYHDTFDVDPNWEDKSEDRAVWRGSTTGVWFDHFTRWRSSQRVRLYWMSQASSGERLVRTTQRKGDREVVVERKVPLSELYNRYLDFAFVGEIHQCTEEDRGCEAARQSIQVKQGMIWNDQNRYKYLLDIDGNAWSGRFHRLMSTNSVVLKATIFKEWYADRIQPWLHYIPIDPSYNDLFDVLSFFSGDLDGQNDHEDLARQIAAAGKKWTETHWHADINSFLCRHCLWLSQEESRHGSVCIEIMFGMGAGNCAG